MPLEPLQYRIAKILKGRRSKNSFVGGSSVFNEEYPRISQDIDILVENVSVSEIANADIAALENAGLMVRNRLDSYGLNVEATVTDGASQTQLEWSEQDRCRFHPIQTHETFGWALHKDDLAVAKLVAAASRNAARDMVDLYLIDQRHMSMAAAAIAAPAKMPGASPIAILEHARKRAMGHPVDDIDMLRLNRERELPDTKSIKFAFADRIEDAIGAITNRCIKARVGYLYVDPTSGAAVTPTDDRLASLKPRAAKEIGIVPFMGEVRPRKRGRGMTD